MLAICFIIDTENSIIVTLIVLMNAINVIIVLHALPDSSSVHVAPTLSPSSVTVSDSVSTPVRLHAVFSLVPSIVDGTRFISPISLVGYLPDPCTKCSVFM